MSEHCIDESLIPRHIMSRTDLTLLEKVKATIDYSRDKSVQIMLDGQVVKKQLDYILKSKNPAEALVNMLRPDRAYKAGKGLGTHTLEFTQDSIRNEAHYMMQELMNDLRPGISDLWTKNNSRNFIRALYKEGTNDAKAVSYSKAWDKVYDHLDSLYRARGGYMRLDRFSRIPVSHNIKSIIDDGFENWSKYLTGRIDETKINSVYRTEILMDMFEELEYSAASITKKSRKRSPNRSDEDEIVFKDSKSWEEYNEKYGDTNLYDAMQDQVTSMSHLTGAMEMFGSKPRRGYELIVKAIESKASPSDAAKTEKVLNRADKIFATSMGHLRSTDSVARALGNVRNLQTGLKLGGAIIPAITDTLLMYATASFIGMPVFSSIQRHIMSIAGGKNKQELSARLLFGLEHMMDVSHSTSRYASVYGSKNLAKFAGGTLKWSGLQGWTIGAKQSFGIEMSMYLSKAIMRPDDFKTRRILNLYGINDSDISIIQSSQRFKNEGVEFVDPMELPSDVRRKWVSMMLAEQKMAVPEADAGIQALVTQGTKQGTFVGEFMRSIMQFKTFPTTLIANHWRRALLQTNGAERYHQVGSLVLGTTMLGVLAVNAKQIINGEEPMMFNGDPANDSKLLFMGFVQGGSGAYVSDMFLSYARSNRRNSNILQQQILGPGFSDINNLFSIAFGDIKLGLDGKASFPGFDSTAAKLLEDEMPNLWYTKLLLRRGITDQLNMATDPKWESKQNKRIRELRREEERGMWWSPGDSSPNFMR